MDSPHRDLRVLHKHRRQPKEETVSPIRAAQQTNLPLALTSFIGRDREMVEVKRLLSKTRLLTLTGPGGCGKTRLALQVAGDLGSAFADGIWLVELASLSEAGLVPDAAALALGIREQFRKKLTETLADHLRSKDMLLVLDNCEHLAEACARLVESLLRVSPGLRILATSREPLNLDGETVWPVPPLSLPHSTTPLKPEDLLQYESVRLFVDRVGAVAPGFALTAENAEAVGQVCTHLDGMPLAIELAATRVRSLPVQLIAARLDSLFSLLTSNNRTALPRHRTLRASMDWSYGLLAGEEQVLFRRLAVFAGHFKVEAVEGICTDEAIPLEGVLELATRLMDKSLVSIEKQGENVRYRLLEMIRQYALDKLEESGEGETLRQRHAAYYADLAERAEGHLFGPQQLTWLNHLEAEHDNLRTALRWSLDRGQVELALRLSWSLWRFWYMRGHLTEGRRWLEETLAAARGGTEPEAASERARALRAKALVGVGVLMSEQGDYAQAQAAFEESLALRRELGDRIGAAWSLNNLGILALYRADFASAHAFFEQVLEIRRGSADRRELGTALDNLAGVLVYEGNYARAAELAQEGLTLFQELDDKQGTANNLNTLGDAVRGQGQYDHAVRLYKQGLSLYYALDQKTGMAECLERLADTACSQGEWEHGVRLFAAARSLREAVAARLPATRRGVYEQSLDRARAGLTAEAFASAWAQGWALTLESAFQYALSLKIEPLEKSRSSLRIPAPALAKSDAVLKILALGPLQVFVGNHALTSSEWAYSKPRELLFYLLSHPPLTKEEISLTLWPDASSVQVRHNFHITLHHLRRVLGGTSWIIFENDHYTFNRSLSYRYDVEAFESGIAQARQLLRLQPGNIGPVIEHLAAAVGLYRGDFLQDVAVGDWAIPRREELRCLYLEALLTLGQLYLQAGNQAEAARAYHQAITCDSYLEAAHRGLMRCFARQGELAQAVRVYKTLCQLFLDELGSPPSPETVALYEQLRRGEPV